MAIMPVPTLTDIPPFPELADRAAGSYNTKAYAFGAHMGDKFNTEIAAVAASVRNNALEAQGSALAAQEAAAGVVEGAAAQAEAAANSAASAADSANAAAAINSAAPWVSGTSYSQFTATISRINGKTYRKTTVTAGGTTDPANDPTNWLLMGSLALPRRARSANINVTASDISALIDITSGTFTQTFDTAANLGAGWFCYIRNTGTGDITIPSSDGLTNWIMYSNECRLFISDGAVLRSIVITPFYKEYAVSANFVKPPGYHHFGGEIWNGGQSGGNGLIGGTAQVWGFGGPGGYGSHVFEFHVPNAKIAATTSVVVGAGGVASGLQSAPGVFGGNSSFGSLGVPTYPNPPPQSAGTYYYGGAAGQTGWVTGGVAMKGAGGGGAGAGARDDTQAIPGYSRASGGVSSLAGNGGEGGALESAGSPGTIPGGGGGGGGGARAGTSTVFKGGDGARGEVRIWGIA